MKGIILAGGSGTRLHPATLSVSKQILPIFDKPMIYYPLSVLMLAGIRDILIISTPRDINLFKELLGNGSQYGIHLSYIIQERPEGLAQAFILGEDFIENENVCLILGDNLFYGHNLSAKLKNAIDRKDGATIFGYYVNDPQRYGVAELGEQNNVISIEEKPSKPKSNYAVTGLYFYDNDVSKIAKEIKPSPRGELEITDINNIYLQKGKLNMEVLGRGFAWLDTGTHDSLLEASNFIQAIENRQGLKVACLEEIAFKNKWISQAKLKERALLFSKTAYGEYLQNLLRNI